MILQTSPVPMPGKRDGLYRRTLLCVLVAAACAACAPTTAQFAPASRDAVDVRGTLFIVGGGSQPEDLVKDFAALAGGPGKTRIAILPMATSDADATAKQ